MLSSRANEIEGNNIPMNVNSPDVGRLRGVKLIPYCCLVLLLISFGVDKAPASESGNNIVTAVSIDEVANQIRKKENWQILDASPRTTDSGLFYFRFKLLRQQDGRVIIVHIDPNNPNLHRLE